MFKFFKNCPKIFFGILISIFCLSSCGNSDPLENIVNDLLLDSPNITADQLKSDFLSSYITEYDGVIPDNLQICLQDIGDSDSLVELFGVEPNGKITADYNSDYASTQTQAEIKTEISPVLGHAITHSPPQINWLWNDSLRKYTFTVYPGDEVFWLCYLREGTEFFGNFLENVNLDDGQSTANPDVLSSLSGLKSCAELNGTICASSQTCSGSWLSASDTSKCCSGVCGTTCTPNCSGKNCGNDGCSGSCGSCESDKICSSGICISPDSLISSDGIIIYQTTESHDGNFGGRNNLDSFCQEQKPAELNCDSIHAFISVNSSDTAREMPQRFIYDRNNPLYWFNAKTKSLVKFSNNWNDMFDEDILVPPTTGLGGSTDFWSGSNYKGDLSTSQGGYNYYCKGWSTTEKTTAGTSYYGTTGKPHLTKGWFTNSGKSACSSKYHVLCACRGEQPSCTPSYYSECYKNSIYLYNSCGNRERREKECQPIVEREWSDPYCYNSTVYKKRESSGEKCKLGKCEPVSAYEYVVIEECESKKCEDAACVPCVCEPGEEIGDIEDWKCPFNKGTVKRQQFCSNDCLYSGYRIISTEKCSDFPCEDAYYKIETPMGPTCMRLATINIGSRSSSGIADIVTFCGMEQGIGSGVTATCNGTWNVNPCAWTSNCSTGWRNISRFSCTPSCP